MSICIPIRKILTFDAYSVAFRKDGEVVSQSTLDRRVSKILENAPVISGSDGDASIFINQQDECSISTSYLHFNNGSECHVLECRDLNTIYILTVYGNLRDREQVQVDKEFKAFLEYLDNKFNGLNVEN